MKKLIALILAPALLLLPMAASAQSLVKPGTCELIVASRSSIKEAQSYIRKMDNTRFAKIFKTSNGWYAISIGALKPNEEDAVLSSWKASGKIPQDAYCSKGSKYIALYNWQTGAKETGRDNVTTTSAPSSNTKYDKDGNPFYTKKFCRIIYNEQNTAQDAERLFRPIQQVFEKRGRWDYYLGVFQLKNGRYVVAETLPFYFERFDWYMGRGGKGKINKSGNPYKNLKSYGGLTQRCTDGTDFAQDTGARLIKKGKKGEDLLLKGLFAGAKALENAAKSSGSQRGTSPSSFCGINDTCYRLVKQRSGGATVQCTKGIYSGSDRCIMSNKKGKWASGCGISDSGAHHYNFETAANKACGQ